MIRNRKCFMTFAAFLVTLLATTGMTLAAEKPNVVVILIDDLGWADLGCYGNTFYESPNIDRLASEGVRFTDAYAACCVCSPTRASIMTGRYPARLHLTDFIPGHPRPWAKLNVPQMNLALPHNEVTIAEALKASGYVSAAIGKWHLGEESHYPDTQGFDVSLVHKGQHFYPQFKTTPPIDMKDGDYLADVLTDQAVAFIESNKDHPFFLYLAHYAVHIPLQAKKEMIAKHANKPAPKDGIHNPIYAAMIESADESVGRVMAALKDNGLDENTMVIFASDNGGLIRNFLGTGPVVTSNDPLRCEKGTQYEGGLRIPMAIRWPGKVAAGMESNQLACTIDLLPTILEAVGAKMPDDREIDGVSLLPVAKQQKTLKRDTLFWHYPHYHHGTPAGAVRHGDYKLIERYEDGYLELYNLENDIGETVNLAECLPDKAKALQKKLHDWLDSVDAQRVTANPDYDPARQHEWGHRFRRPAPDLPEAAVFGLRNSSSDRAPDNSATSSSPYNAMLSTKLLNQAGTCAIWFKLDKELRGAGKDLSIFKSDAMNVFIDPQSNATWIKVQTGPAMTAEQTAEKKRPYEFNAMMTHLKRDHWYHLAWTWHTKYPERSSIYIDGIRQAGMTPDDQKGLAKPTETETTATIGDAGLTVSSLYAYLKPLEANQVRDIHDSSHHVGYTNEGVRFTGDHFRPRDVDIEHPIYETTFADAGALNDWVLEGGRKMSVANGSLVLESDRKSERSETNANHLVCWLKREVPADFCMEFTVRPEDRNRGLNIVFFNARGKNGESIFDESLAKRDGTFRQYYGGDLNNYHISYWAGGRGTANLRKNSGFNLAAIGQDLIQTTPANAFQTVRLYKRGGMIRLTVDDLVAVEYDDDGESLGPVHNHSGWIGLRQMGHTQRCEYGYVKVWPLRK